MRKASANFQRLALTVVTSAKLPPSLAYLSSRLPYQPLEPANCRARDSHVAWLKQNKCAGARYPAHEARTTTLGKWALSSVSILFTCNRVFIYYRVHIITTIPRICCAYDFCWQQPFVNDTFFAVSEEIVTRAGIFSQQDVAFIPTADNL